MDHKKKDNLQFDVKHYQEDNATRITHVARRKVVWIRTSSKARNVLQNDGRKNGGKDVCKTFLDRSRMIKIVIILICRQKSFNNFDVIFKV